MPDETSLVPIKTGYEGHLAFINLNEGVLFGMTAKEEEKQERISAVNDTNRFTRCNNLRRIYKRC